MKRPPPKSTLFPYPTLFRSEVSGDARALAGGLLVLAGALSYAGGALYFQRRFATLPPLAVVAGTLVGCAVRSEEHTSELQSRQYLVCRLLLEKKKKNKQQII